MTSANGTLAGNCRRPSAAFLRIARGALPSGQTARTAKAARAFSAGLWAVTLTAALVLPSSAALAAGHAATQREAVRSGQPPATAGKPTRPAVAARHRTIHPAARRLRLRDAPQELLPAALPGAAMAEAGNPRATCLAAARRAEAVHGLPNGLLVAIALSESGLHAHALNIGGRAHFPSDLATARRLLAEAPAHRTVMAGCLQVNARVHARGSDWPLDPVRSADWAGGMLRRWHMETGTWDEAIGRWHGGSAGSTRRMVCRVRARLEVTAPGSNVLSGQTCHAREILQARRNDAALLEVAEMPDP